MKSINESILPKSKKKRILLVSSEEVHRNLIIGKISEHYKVTSRSALDKTEINFEYNFENKATLLKIIESTGYESNSHYVKVSEVSKAAGIIFIFNKDSSESLKYIKKFTQNYHSVIGNKFFPCVFVQNETVSSNTIYSTSVTKSEIKELTMNGCFPILKVKNDFDIKECTKMLNVILTEIKKEKNDDFPYSLAYQEQLNINYCIKNHKLFGMMNVLTLTLIMLFTFLDTVFIINTQDFLNELNKVDDVFLGIRLNMNAVNFISVIVFVKYALFDRQKYDKIRRLEKYVVIVNLVSWAVQFILHFRIQHLIKHNEKYYSINVYQIIVVILLVVSYQIMKCLTISNPQKQKRKGEILIIH